MLMAFTFPQLSTGKNRRMAQNQDDWQAKSAIWEQMSPALIYELTLTGSAVTSVIARVFLE